MFIQVLRALQSQSKNKITNLSKKGRVSVKETMAI